MQRREPYGLTKPCPKCPFRSDIEPYIRPARVREIERSLVRAEFPCHETTGVKGEASAEGGTMHCAGALILMEKEGWSSQMMRISERVGLYDHRKLDMVAPVYETFDEMHAAHVRAERTTKKRAGGIL